MYIPLALRDHSSSLYSERERQVLESTVSVYYYRDFDLDRRRVRFSNEHTGDKYDQSQLPDYRAQKDKMEAVYIV